MVMQLTKLSILVTTAQMTADSLLRSLQLLLRLSPGAAWDLAQPIAAEVRRLSPLLTAKFFHRKCNTYLAKGAYRQSLEQCSAFFLGCRVPYIRTCPNWVGEKTEPTAVWVLLGFGYKGWDLGSSYMQLDCRCTLPLGKKSL